MEIKEFLKEIKKLNRMGISEIRFSVGEHPANDYCCFDTDFDSKIAVLHNGIIFH